MPHQFIADLAPGQRVEDDIYLIRSKDLRTTTQGSLYIHAVLQDRSGQVLSRIWQASEEMFTRMPEGGFMHFRGRAENYKGNLQFIIEGMRLADPGTFDLADYLPASRNDVDRMWDRVQEILCMVKQPDLRAMVDEFLADEEMMTRFRKAPAASAKHHAYIGGLLEHTLGLLELALRVMPMYPRLSQDLVLTGLFLHDIGKTVELSYETSIGYTDQGQLIGHLVQATIWIDHKAKAITERTGKPFPDRLLWVLQHIVLSHHGQYEFGSPKLPAIPEAVAIHYLDNLDAKITMFLAEIDADRDPADPWTNYNTALGTKIYKLDPTGVRQPSSSAGAGGGANQRA